MLVEKYLKFRIDEMKYELSDLISEMEKIAHSPNEIEFTAGRIAELNEQITKLEADYEKYHQEDLEPKWWD
ncbi:TPA: hypothetical protein ACXNW8_001356 [Clostridium botulinum]|uniref:hypothetical protein n=1 Tax=Clostridium botulinum TaxID=1491 RepID=UPI001C9BB441|nr:hypothetical protein [Clostridium botulinum]MBY6909558.1 hypothetical protein [Clostridium botulinum]